MQKSIKHNLDKKQALLLVKKAISGKIAIMKDEGDTIKIGAPMMTATVTVTDSTFEVSGKLTAEAIAQTAATEIEMALENLNNGGDSNPGSASVPSQGQRKSISADEYLEYQNKTIALLKQYKDLYDAKVLTDEEFETKKEDLLNFINGMTHK